MLTLLALLATAQPPGKPFAPPPGLADVPVAEDAFPPADPTVKLPHPEHLLRTGLRSFAVRPAGGGYALYAGAVPVRDFGPDRQAADDAHRAVTALLNLTDWGSVGGRVTLDYALVNSRAAPTHQDGGRHQSARRLDLSTVRADAVRGAWLLRDAGGLLVNFGPDQAAAEQAAAVCRRYGFNRLLAVGGADQPAFRLLFAAPTDRDAGRPATDPGTAALQDLHLSRTGVPVPGGGYVGERLVIDARKLDVRRERADWVLAHGRDVLARFGGDDTAAREAVRVVKDGRFTEFCTVGGLTFFLANGQPPARVPFAARGTPFRPDQLKAVPLDGKWAVADGGRTLFPAATEAEAQAMIGVVGAFRFDTVCRLGANPRAGLTFLARTGGR